MDAFLDEHAVARLLAGTPFTRIRVVDHTASTNADLVADARAGAPAGSVLLTADQRAGRGRFDRSWVAPRGTAVALSVLVRPERPMAAWGWLSLLTGVAVARGIAAATGLRPALKWPNDVLIGGRKVCGILSELVPGEPPGAVVGMGINVALTEADLPVPTATSLTLAGADVSGTAVAVAVLRAWADEYENWARGVGVRESYLAWCATLGQQVGVQVDATTRVVGRAVDVDADGALVVETASGPRAFAAGDVVHLRPHRGAE